MNTATDEVKTMLKDAGLFRQQCYINGEWIDADNKATIPVKNLQPAQSSGACLRWAQPKPGAPLKQRMRLACWRARTAKERGAICASGLTADGQSGRPCKADDAEQGKPLAESKGEVAYGASFVGGSPRKASGFMVTPFQRHQRQASRSHQGTHRCLRRDHPVELSHRDDHRKVAPALAAGCVGSRKARWTYSL